MEALFYVAAIFGISLLVIAHECGHYFVARAFGMRVTRFAIGFGPAIAKWTPKGSPTTFQLGAIPVLAYVQIAGMNPGEDADPDDPGLFTSKGVFARIATIFAGSGANYLIASLAFFVIATTTGLPEDRAPNRMEVNEITVGSPAEHAGLRHGDVIVEANGTSIHSIEDLMHVTTARANQPTVYVVVRGGHRLDPITITPQQVEGRGIIGVSARVDRVYRRLGFGDAAKYAVLMPVLFSAGQVMGIAQMIKHRTTQGLTSVVGMTKLVAQQAKSGVAPYVSLLAQLSIAVGFLNLLPLPGLDGGRLMFLAYEVVTRRRPNERVEAIVHTVGLLLLVGVVLLVMLREVIS